MSDDDLYFSDLSELSSDEVEDRPSDDHLMLEPGVQFAELQNYILASPFLAKKLSKRTKTLEKICAELSALMNQKITLEALMHVCVAASLAFLVNIEDDFYCHEMKKSLLLKTFRYSDTLDPRHLHLMTRSLWSALQTDDSIDTLKNVLLIAQKISTANTTGKAIAICLMWAILAQITKTEVQMHRIRGYNDWTRVLEMVDFNPSADKALTRYLVVMVIAFLVTAFVCGNNSELQLCGYSTYLTLEIRHVKALKLWAESVLVQLTLYVSDMDTGELLMVTKEAICFNVIGPLGDKLLEME